ncbi:MAG: type II secretion system protein [Candidatus Daviesbacteria bacterium]
MKELRKKEDYRLLTTDYRCGSRKTEVGRQFCGFTLVELLVAISIVAVLATIGFTLFQTTQAQSRDGRRRMDINALSTALENHFDVNTGIYASPSSTWFAEKRLPLDPLNSGDYVYYENISINSASYIVCARLERGGGNFTDQGVTPGTGDYYCRLNQQQ